MAIVNELRVKSFDDLGHLKIQAVLTPGFRFRNWLMQQLIKLAGRIAVMEVDITIVEE